MRTHVLAAIAAVAFLSGCATNQLQSFDANGANDALNEWSCRGAPSAANRECYEAYRHSVVTSEDQQYRAARLLRAHGLTVMFARYAAARFPGYSDDLPNDATRMIGRLEAARATLDALDGAAYTNTMASRLYVVERVDGLLALVDVAVAATAPTRRHLFRLAFVSTPADRLAAGPDLLRNALRDKLYLDSYRDYLEALRADVGSDPAKLKAAVAELDKQLALYCGQLSALAKLEKKTCIPAK
jgi:hypothetical protein